MRFDCPHSQVPASARIAAVLMAALAFLLLSPRAPVVRVTAAAAATGAPQHAEPARAGATQGEASEDEHGSGWIALIAKIVNFSILAYVLARFLRAPIAAYLASRSAQIRQELVTAAETREMATRQLAEIETKLKALPAELEMLKRRGAEEIAAERVRIEHAAEAERQRLLEQARREIDARLRIAKRELLEHAAELAVNVAADRIQSSITPDDQARLVDRYTMQLAEASR